MDVHYGVVKQNGVWTIIGRGLRFGSYADRALAEGALRRLADNSPGRAVHLHLQDETGELMPPTRVD